MDKKYCFPTNFEEELIEEAARLNKKSENKVYEFYGTTRTCLTGGGRPAKILKDVDEKELERHIVHCHENDFRFNFLLNGACMGAREFEDNYRKKILDFVGILKDLKVDIVTISNPYVVKAVREKFPSIEICLSIIAGTDSLRKVKFFEDFGVDRIVLMFNINRDFQLLKKIRNNVDVELEVLANASCLLHCPLKRYHHEIDSHLSIEEKEIPLFPSVFCEKRLLKDKEEIIKSPWIRPSDAHHYFDLGIDYVKLSGREMDTDWIADALKHYLFEEDGDDFYRFIKKYGWGLYKDLDSDLEKLEVTIPELPEDFLSFFKNGEIECGTDCEDCGYCKKIAEEYVKIKGKGKPENYVESMEELDSKADDLT